MGKTAGTQVSLLKQPALWIALVTLLVMIVWFSPSENWSWDPSFYYAHFLSPVIDGDVDFRNNTETGSRTTSYTVTGLQNSNYPVGVSILWAPFFILAHLLTLVVNPSQANGLSNIYLVLVSAGSVMYGMAALYLIYQMCVKFTNKALALATTILCGFATPLFFYMFRQPLMAHTTGLFANALMLYIYLKLSEQDSLNRYSGVWFGFSLGLCVMTRYYSIVMGIVPLVYYLGHLQRALKSKSCADVRRVIWQVILMLVLILILATPQMALWYRLHHKLLVFPQRAETYTGTPYLRNLVNVIVSTNRGLLFWCPFILLGITGLPFIKDKRIRSMALVYLVMLLMAVISRKDWFGGGGYGTRYWVEIMPFTALGFITVSGALFENRRWRWLVIPIMLLVVVHQLVLVYSVEHGADGWITLQPYFRGESLGLRWQLNNLLRLLREPGLFFAPRRMGDEHQSIIVNVLGGIRKGAAYAITVPSAMLVTLFAYGWVRVFPLLMRKHVNIVFGGITLWFVIWAIVYVFVG